MTFTQPKPNQKMKVIHLITDLHTGGAEMMLYKLLSAENKDRFESSVVSLMDKGTLGDRIEALGLPIHTVDMTQGKPTVESLFKLAKIVRGIKPDLIQGWMYHGNLASQLATVSAFGSIPTLWNIRNCIYSLAEEKPMTARIIKLSSQLSTFPAKIVYNSHTSIAQHEQLGYQAAKTVMIPNGFDTTLLQPSAAAYADVRKKLNLAEDAFLIGRVGRYHEIKDYITFVRAAKQVLDHCPAVQFLLVGPGVDWQNEVLVAEIQSLGIRESVHLLGDRHDMPEITAALDVSCSSSSHGEAFPNVIGEAMACAVPCVATDVGDSAMILADTGHVVPPRDPAALAAGVRSLIQLEASERSQLGQRARKRVQDCFSLSSIAQQYEQLYTSVCQ